MCLESHLNLPGELDLIADIEVDAEVQELTDALIIPARQHFARNQQSNRSGMFATTLL